MESEMDQAFCPRVSPRGRSITTASEAPAGMGVVAACGFGGGIGGSGGAADCFGVGFDGDPVGCFMGKILAWLVEGWQ